MTPRCARVLLLGACEHAGPLKTSVPSYGGGRQSWSTEPCHQAGLMPCRLEPAARIWRPHRRLASQHTWRRECCLLHPLPGASELSVVLHELNCFSLDLHFSSNLACFLCTKSCGLSAKGSRCNPGVRPESPLPLAQVHCFQDLSSSLLSAAE